MKKIMNLTQNARKVLEKRYLAKNSEGKVVETPEEMLDRVSKAVAKAEENYGQNPDYWAEKFYDLMADLKFLPNSPTLMNAGRELGQLSACFVLPVEDSMEGIFETIKNAALIHKSGGGTGFSFSRLRPKGATVKSTGGVASGPVSFMRVFNAATEAVKQGGTRRGANMGILRVDHPDILEFIQCKRDNKEFTNFNISVAITDKFMKALKDDDYYELVEPHTGKIAGKLKAREVFDLIVEMAWLNGEPGVVFIDRINAKNPTPHVGHIESTNPCVTGDTLVATERGLVPAAKLKVGDRIVTPLGLKPITAVYNNGIQDVFEVVTKSGFRLKATKDHKLQAVDGQWVPVEQLKPGDRVRLHSSFIFPNNRLLPEEFEVINLRQRTGWLLPLEFDDQYGFLLGMLVGNGYYSTSSALYFGQEEADLLRQTKDILDSWQIQYRIRTRGKTIVLELPKGIRRLWEAFGAVPGRSRYHKVPKAIFQATKSVVAAFLSAFFSCSGSIDGDGGIRATSASRDLLQDIQLLLLGFGIRSRIRRQIREKASGFGSYCDIYGRERTYTFGEYYDILISPTFSSRFMNEIGIASSEKALRLLERGTGKLGKIDDSEISTVFEDEIESIEFIGREEVFDVTEPETLTWITNGFISFDCGEQPLLPYESCFASDTRIMTDKGWETVEEAYRRQCMGEQVSVYTDGLITNETGLTLRPATVIPIGERDIVTVELHNGQRLRVTPDHKVLTQRGWVMAASLTEKDYVYLPEGAFLEKEIDAQSKKFFRMLGWMVGDGWHTEKSSGLVFGPGDIEAEAELLPVFQELCTRFINPLSNGRIPTGSRAANGVLTVASTNTGVRQFLVKCGFEFALSGEKRVPDCVMMAEKEAQVEFLRGLFGAEGTVDARRAKVSLTTASRGLAGDIQLLLLGLGIKSRVQTYRHKDGREWSYVLITNKSLDRFAEIIGFPMNPAKEKRLVKWIRNRQRIYRDFRRSRVKSVTPSGRAYVYDVSEPVTHSLIAEGMIVHNCNLGSINLSKFVKDGEIDYNQLKHAVHTAVRFLDDVIDVNKYPLPEIEKMTKANRKIGLGVMGFADMLIKLGIPYDSEEAIKLAEKVMGFIQSEARKASQELAKTRGAFPNFTGSVYDVPGGPLLRNATVTTIAPTGTISIIAGCSSGIEPVFALAFERNVLDKQRLIEIYPLFEEEMKRRGLYSNELMEEVLEKGSLKDIKGIPEEVKRVFVTAHDISPEWHVRIQAAFQKYTDNAVSKTVNFPHSATCEDVKKVYLLAYELGCKGVTVYRDKSREEQVLNKGTKEGKMNNEDAQKYSRENYIIPRPRPPITYGSTEKVKIGCGNLYITVNSDENGICEVFTNLGRAGGCPSQSEATSRLISLALRSGVDVNAIIEQLKGIRCLSTIRQMANNKDIKVLSCPDAIARALERNILKNEDVKEEKKNGSNGVEYYQRLYEVEEGLNDDKANKCPECGSSLESDGGCVVCRSCGFSKCG